MSGCYRTFILEKSSNSYPTHKHSRHATMWTHYIYSNGQESKPQEILFSNRYNWVKKKELQSPLYTCCERFFLLASRVSCNRMWAACRQGGQPDSQPVNRNYLRRVMMRWVRNGQRRVEKKESTEYLSQVASLNIRPRCWRAVKENTFTPCTSFQCANRRHGSMCDFAS